MSTTETTTPVEDRVAALESGASSWAALVGEDVRQMRRDLDALRAEVEELRGRLGESA